MLLDVNDSMCFTLYLCRLKNSRLLAIDLGIPIASDEKKRAIQFGARSAKMFDSKTKGDQEISLVDVVAE